MSYVDQIAIGGHCGGSRRSVMENNMKIMFVSLGCDKNLVDTEMMLALLSEQGYLFTDDEYEADVIVVNTCCFIGDAKEESINTLISMGERKKDARCKTLIAAGCLAQRYHDEIRRQIPEVDAVIGTMAFEKISRAVEETAGAGTMGEYLGDLDRPPVAVEQLVTTGGHYAYLKIAEGCDKNCTYCIIPKVRGRYRSIPIETLLEHAARLVRGGVKELIVVAQETTLYGVDLYGEKRLPELLSGLCRINGLHWIRVLYCYPEEITEELIQTIKSEPKICHYLDIPVQHASDGILRRMARRTNRQELKNMIGRIREAIPDICLRTTLITGFPGESEKDHEELMQFVDEMEFDRLGVFMYSQEEDTPAASFPEQIPEEIKKERQSEIMELQQEIAFDHAEKMRGQEITAMIEGMVADENVYVGRTYMDAPDVDGLIFVHADRELLTGEFVKVRVTGSYEYDLIGELI